MAKGKLEYWGLDGVNFAALKAVLAQSGPDAWLKIRPDGDKLFFSVIEPGNAAVAGVGEIDDTWTCPPFCK